MGYWDPLPDYVLAHYRNKAEQEKIQKEMNDHFYKDVGLWLRKHRLERGFTVDQLLKKTRIDSAAYTRYEKGAKPITLLHFVLLCRALKVEFRYNENFRVEPGEKAMIEAIRHRDIKTVLTWVLEEM